MIVFPLLMLIVPFGKLIELGERQAPELIIG